MAKTMKQTKIDPGPGYRLLKVGEVIQDGDEYMPCLGGDYSSAWTPTGDAGKKFVESFLRYRRRTGKPAKPAVTPEPAKHTWNVNIGNAHVWSNVTDLECFVSGSFTRVSFTNAGGDPVSVITAATVVTVKQVAPSDD